MQTSVTLTQLPYTGFDYGQTYNSLYWVALLVWSLIIAAVLVRNKKTLAKGVASLAKVFIIEKKVRAVAHASEAVILTERVVKFDPLVDPIAARKIREGLQVKNYEDATTTQDAKILTHDTGKTVSEMIHTELETKDSTQEMVKELVEKELAVSRIGQTPDEFGSEDFATVDFDGINPDESWATKPKQESGSATSSESEDVENIPDKGDELRAMNYESKKREQEASTYYDELKNQDMQNPKPLTQSSLPETPIAHVEKGLTQEGERLYVDKITLDTSSDFPKLVLKREDVT